MFKFIRNLFLTLIFIILCGYIFLKIPTSTFNNLNQPRPTKNIEEIPDSQEILSILCSDSYITRQVGSNGNKLAADYIETLFKKIKLEPVFGNTYLNAFNASTHCDENGNAIMSKDKSGVTTTIVQKAYNVAGKIKGKNNKSAIVITSHFDCWGKGAFDNGSGVITALEIANNLKKVRKLINSIVM